MEALNKNACVQINQLDRSMVQLVDEDGLHNRLLDVADNCSTISDATQGSAKVEEDLESIRPPSRCNISEYQPAQQHNLLHQSSL